MTLQEFVSKRIEKAYHDDEVPCSIATLRILEELFQIKIEKQVYDSAWGLNGAGQYRAQCGLVEGTLLFIGLLANQKGMDKEKIYEACFEFAKRYEKKFGSLRCKELRPGGFNDDDPPHLCEPLSVDSVIFSAKFISDWFKIPIIK